MGSDGGNGICLMGGLVCGLIFGVLVGVTCTAAYQVDSWQKDAVKRGFAEHDQQTGIWRWKETAEQVAP